MFVSLDQPLSLFTSTQPRDTSYSFKVPLRHKVKFNWYVSLCNTRATLMTANVICKYVKQVFLRQQAAAGSLHITHFMILSANPAWNRRGPTGSHQSSQIRFIIRDSSTLSWHNSYNSTLKSKERDLMCNNGSTKEISGIIQLLNKEHWRNSN